MKRRELSHPRTLAWTVVWLATLALLGEAVLRSRLPWRVNSLEPHLLRDPRDDWTHLAFLLERLKRSPPRPGVPRVLLMGGSVSNYSLGDTAEVERQVLAKSGTRVEFVRVVNRLRSFLQDLQILEALADHLSGVTLILPVSARRMTLARGKQEDLSFLPVPDKARAVFEELGVPLEPATSQLRRAGPALAQALKKRLEDPRAIAFDALPPAREPASDAQLRERTFPPEDEFLDERALNHRLLELVLDTATARGARVVLVEHPHNPRVARPAFAPEFRARIAALAKRPGVQCLDARTPWPLSAEDFWDFEHLIDDGRQKFLNWFTDVLPTLLDVRR